jgi:hypothetical protein
VEQASEGTREDPLLSIGPLTLTTKCVNGPSTVAIGIYGSTPASNASFGWGYTTTEGVASAEITSIDATPKNLLTFVDNALGEVAAGQVFYWDSGTTITFTFHAFVSDLFEECRLHGVALQAQA